MKKEYWIIVAIIAVGAIAFYVKRQMDSVETKAKLDFEDFKDDFGKAQPIPFSSGAIDNGAIIPDDFEPSWTVS
jgi:hypothetical protein